MLFGKSIDVLSLDDLQALVENGTPEGRRLEYKRDHYGRTNDAKREFAADISAMANASGGYLLIGIDEDDGSAAKVVGVEVDNQDSLKLRIFESIRTSIEPPIHGLRVQLVEIDAGRAVIVIHVPRSWNAPHCVTLAGSSRFFLRDENGKHQMSVSELRHAFLLASGIEERIRRFRAERLQLLMANEGPLGMDESSPRMVLHVVPQAAFMDGIQLQFDRDRFGIRPLGGGGWNSMYSIDGFVSYSGSEEVVGTVRAFSTLFRNGVGEVVAKLYADDSTLSLSAIEGYVVSGVENILTELKWYSVPLPYYIMLSLVGVRDLSAAREREHFGRMRAYPYRADRVLLPELMVDDAAAESEPYDSLRHLFDLLWNAFGQRGSPNYDADGRYRSS